MFCSGDLGPWFNQKNKNKRYNFKMMLEIFTNV